MGLVFSKEFIIEMPIAVKFVFMLLAEYPGRDLNSCRRRERAVSLARLDDRGSKKW